MSERLFKRIDTVFLPVRNLDHAIAWYTATLGLTLRWRARTGAYAALDVAETPLTLVQTEAFHPVTVVPFNFYTPDIQQAHAALRAAGAEVDEITDYDDVLAFDFTDPDGNRLGVCYFPES